MKWNPAWFAAIIPGTIALLSFAGWVINRMLHVVTETTRFLDDWKGQPGHPGVLDRLSGLEGIVKEIRTETRPNGGESMRDQIHQIGRNVATNTESITKLKHEFERQRRRRFWE